MSTVLLLALSLGLASSTYGGPGPDYWSRKPKAESTKPEAKPLCPLDETCPNSQLVSVTETRRTWPNGRGPLDVVQVGFQRICYTCGGTTTVLRSVNGNGRPPYHWVKVPARHDCTGLIVAKN